MCTRDKAIGILGEVYSNCKAIYPKQICDAYLYGSYARGDYTAESDIDILLTVDMTITEIASFRGAVAAITSSISLKHDITVSVTVKPADMFNKYSDVLPYYKNVLAEGIRYEVR